MYKFGLVLMLGLSLSACKGMTSNDNVIIATPTPVPGSTPTPTPAPTPQVTAESYKADSQGRMISQVIDFGTITGVTSKTFLVKNTTSGSLSFDRSGGAGSEFNNFGSNSSSNVSITTTCPPTLSPNQTCPVTITLDPTTIVENHFRTIIFGYFSNPNPSSYIFGTGFSVQITADLVGQENLLTSSSAGTLVGGSNIDTSSMLQSVGIGNYGSGNLKNVQVWLPLDYEYVISNCSSVLQPGITCSIYTRYTGTASSFPTGILTVTAVDDLGTPFTLSFDISQ